MSDKYINEVGVQTIRDWANGKFALDADLDDLSGRVDDIIAEGGEPNVIETVKVNGTALVPDANKAVDIPVPTQTSELTNNGDGDSPYATEAYVEANGGKIDTIKVNGTEQTITNKAVDLAIPTAVSELTNDNGYQNATQVQSAIDAALSGITGIDFQVVSELPSTGEHGVIYLLANTSTSPNAYDEYIWITPEGGTARYEKIGTTEVDLSNYWTSESGHGNSLVAMTVAEVNAILNA